jgi:hypothetical protein
MADELPKPFGPKYQERTEHGYHGDECILCGKRTSRNGRTNGKTLHVRVVDGGSRIALPDEQVDERGDMGYFPVGSECAKSIPAPYKTTLEVSA